jgi:hypothetical protein
MHRLVALLPPEDAGLVTAALEAVARSDGLPPREEAQDRWAGRRSDALVAVSEHALGSAPEELVGAPGAVQMVVHVDVGVLTGEQPEGRCHLEDGTPIAAAVARRLGCDADIVAITEKDGLPIDVGRRKRLFTARQRRALQARDRTCRFPGCPVPATRTRGHHIHAWWLGGRTDIGNGLSLCNTCTMGGSTRERSGCAATRRASCTSRRRTARRSRRRSGRRSTRRRAARRACATSTVSWVW